MFTTTGGTPGSQYTSIHFTETLILAGLTPSIGTVGDALDNALAETSRRYKTECIRDGSPFRIRPLETVADMEKIASQWVLSKMISILTCVLAS